MAKLKDASVLVAPNMEFTVHRPNKGQVKITGSALSIEIRDGSLCVLSGGIIHQIYAPGQWATVNVPPM